MTTNIELKDNECALILNEDLEISIYLSNKEKTEDRIMTTSEQVIAGIGILLDSEDFINYVLDEMNNILNNKD